MGNVIQGITKRWLLNMLSIIVAFVILVIISLSFFVHSIYYDTIEQRLNLRGSELVNTFINFKCDDLSDFLQKARDYMEFFPDKELMELTIINSIGEPIITSTGFAPDPSQEIPDFVLAQQGSLGYAFWYGKLNSGEPIMALTRIIDDHSGHTIGALRYTVSVENTNISIGISIGLFVIAGLIIIILVCFSGNYFIKSIVRPVRELSDAADKLSKGDFSAKINKLYDDEIGRLVDSINNMAQELQDAEQLKNDFISRVSHELRTPLTAIKGWAETMHIGGSRDEEIFEKGMKVIIDEASRLTNIVEELLDFSRIQANKMVLVKEKLDIIAELDESIYMIKERVFQEGKYLLYDEPENAVYSVIGDKNRLRQVFLNIMDNALKYTDTGDVVGIDIKELDNFVKIIFSDNGCGILSEDLPHVKEKFYKANQKAGGSGIGLAVADEIVNLHGGVLSIESSIGVGTTVIIALPIDDGCQGEIN